MTFLPRRGILLTVTTISALALTALFVPQAGASTAVAGSKQYAAVKSLSKQSKVVKRGTKIRVRGKRVSITQGGIVYDIPRIGVFRSQIDRAYTRIDLISSGSQQRYTALLKRSRGRNKLLFWGQRYDIAEHLCATRTPNSLVILDLGLDPVSKGSFGIRRCRYERGSEGYVRRMSPDEVAGIKSIYEAKFTDLGDGSFGWVSPVQAEFREVSTSCEWNETSESAPGGKVSKLDPRFGVLSIGCVGGSVNGDPSLYSSHLLVSRAGSSGQFTRLIAHVIPTWSLFARACIEDRRWDIATRTRIALEFCTPFPGVLKDLNDG